MHFNQARTIENSTDRETRLSQPPEHRKNVFHQRTRWAGKSEDSDAKHKPKHLRITEEEEEKY